jgi:uncharacterized membrane protein YhhN
MTRTHLIFAIPVAVSAVATIVADARGWRRGLYVFKPLTLVIIIAMLVVLCGGERVGAGWLLVGAALVASLVGDVLMMLPSDAFVASLVSFLVAHGFYIGAFATSVAEAQGFFSRPAFWFPLAALVVYAVVVFRYLSPGLGALARPVAVYVTVITVMGWLAVSAFVLHRDARSTEAFAGALLFMCSDTLLAIDRFRSNVPVAQAYILGTYFAAQWLIATSACAG